MIKKIKAKLQNSITKREVIIHYCPWFIVLLTNFKKEIFYLTCKKSFFFSKNRNKLNKRFLINRGRAFGDPIPFPKVVVANSKIVRGKTFPVTRTGRTQGPTFEIPQKIRHSRGV